MEDAGGAPYAGLTPDCVLDALGSVGQVGDGRLLTLNSYENRVYQVWLDESADTMPPQRTTVVAKFYRPSRWTDVQILEEHAFARELAQRMDGTLSVESAEGHTEFVLSLPGGSEPSLR